jgi:hypothetical protein
MSSFPNFSNVAPYVVKNIDSRKGNTKKISQLNCWARIISAVGDGLIITSNPNISLFNAAGVESESSLYGSPRSSGTIGTDWNGKAVNAQNDSQVGLPRPSITSFEVDEGSGNISRKASFSITVYTLAQLEEVTKYFLEPGFTVFLEWGWNTANGVKPLAESAKGMTTDYVTKAASAGELLKAREDSEGEYECYLGFITGGDVSIQQSYWVVSVELTGFTELPSFLNVADNTKSNFCSGSIESEKAAAIEKETLLGKKRFKMMFNALPSVRRTNLVKDVCLNDDNITHPVNFINFDEKIREQITARSTSWWRELKGFFSKTAGAEAQKGQTLPTGADIIGSERFIRFGTLMDILNKDGLTSITIGTKVIKMSVNTKNTPISAFNQIFSIDKSKLIVPNQQTPNFSLEEAKKNGTQTVNKDEFTDCSIKSTSNKTNFKRIKFPYRTDIKGGMVDGIKLFYDTDESIVKLDKKGTDWGFLDDLYINFDFACSIIDTPKLSLRDALYEMLNGMSSAVNGLWNFQIEELYDANTGTVELRVVDMNFISRIQTNNTDSSQIFNFDVFGINSLFIESSFKMDIGGEMMNKIIGERLAANVNPSNTSISGRLFAVGLSDKVLNEIKTECPPTGSSDSTELSKNEIENQAIKNAEDFVERVGVYPIVTVTQLAWLSDTIKSAIGGGVISEEAYFISYDDKNLFNLYKGEAEVKTIKDKQEVSIPLPITFSFTIHGISGIKRGDMFTVNGLPQRYGAKNGFFQVRSIKHTVQDMLWTTSVEGMFRHIRTPE